MFFLLLGIVAPLLNEEFVDANLIENDVKSLNAQREEGFFSGVTTTFKIIANIYKI